MKLEPYQIVGIFGIAAGAFLFFTPQGKQMLNQFQIWFNNNILHLPQQPVFVRPAPTNAYVPDPDISEWSYRNAVRKDYEALERLESGYGIDQIPGFNVAGPNASWERHLQKKYGL